jgi:hypothetical protein
MDCIITVKGDGVGRNGHPKTDKTGPIRDFLVDNEVFYRAVKNHVAACNKCDPYAILDHHLQRRLDPAFWSTKKKKKPVPVFPVSASLVRLARQYDRLFPGKLKGIVRTYIKLSSSDDFINFIAFWNEQEIFERVKRYADYAAVWRWPDIIQMLAEYHHSNAALMAQLMQLRPDVIRLASSIDEAIELSKISEVMNS